MIDKSILIIEESLELRNLFRLILEQIGIYKNSVSFSSSCIDAKQYLNQTTQTPRLIFLDIDPKQNDGLSLLRELKNDLKFKDIAITTISVDDSLKNECINLGANFIKKPFEIDEIKDEVLNLEL